MWDCNSCRHFFVEKNLWLVITPISSMPGLLLLAKERLLLLISGVRNGHCRGLPTRITG